MPGICGILNLSESLDLAPIMARMIRSMRHHSWYVTEEHIDEGAGLGLGRVSLGYVNRAKQPAAYDDGALIAVMDGEIYEPDRILARVNRAALGPGELSQAALLLAGYRTGGVAFLRELHGSFGAAIWDSARRRLILVNDRFGTRPIYYTTVAERFLFGSQLSSLMADGAVSREPSARGLAQFFTFGQYLRDDTSLEAVRVLPAASHAWIDSDDLRLRVESYERSPAAAVSASLSRHDLLESLDAQFARAVERRVGGTQRLGMALSGGLDARTILGVIDHSQTTLQTVCLGMPGSLDHASSAKLASLVGCRHHNHVLGSNFLEEFRRHLDEMVWLTDGQYLSQCIVMPTLPLYRKLGIEVLLRGHAGELMHMRKAYNYSLDPAGLKINTEVELDKWLFQRLQAYMLDGVDKPLFRGDLQREMPALARESLNQDLADVRHIDPPLQRVWALFVRQRLRRETMLSLVKFRSVVEPRLPFLDNDLVDALMAVPPELKLEEAIQEFILRKRRPSFLTVANANTGARVGASKLVRQAASIQMRVLAKLGVPGYQPYERLGLWLRQDLADIVKKILLGDECLGNGVFAPEGVRRVVNHHLENQRNHTFLLLALMIYELGRRRMAATTRQVLDESPVTSD